MKWEKIDNETMRASVPSGWLVKIVQVVIIKMQQGDPKLIGRMRVVDAPYGTMAMTFVPDSEHKWELEKDEEGTESGGNGRKPKTGETGEPSNIKLAP